MTDYVCSHLQRPLEVWGHEGVVHYHHNVLEGGEGEVVGTYQCMRMTREEGKVFSARSMKEGNGGWTLLVWLNEDIQHINPTQEIHVMYMYVAWEWLLKCEEYMRGEGVRG